MKKDYFSTENKRYKQSRVGFSFGSMGGSKADMLTYMPKPWGLSAQFLKVVQELGGAPREFFNDSACVSNLASHKGNLIRYNKQKQMYVLTHRGRYYLKTRNVVVPDVNEWLLANSWIRYIKDPIDQLVAKLIVDDKKGFALMLRRAHADYSQERRKLRVGILFRQYSYWRTEGYDDLAKATLTKLGKMGLPFVLKHYSLLTPSEREMNRLLGK